MENSERLTQLRTRERILEITVEDLEKDLEEYKNKLKEANKKKDKENQRKRRKQFQENLLKKVQEQDEMEIEEYQEEIIKEGLVEKYQKGVAHNKEMIKMNQKGIRIWCEYAESFLKDIEEEKKEHHNLGLKTIRTRIYD